MSSPQEPCLCHSCCFVRGLILIPLIWASSLPLAREADAGPCHQPFCRAQFWPLGCAVTWNSRYLPFPHHSHVSLPLAFGFWLIFQFLELDASHSHLGSLPRLFQPPPSGPSSSCRSAEPSLPRCFHISKHMLISYGPQGGMWAQSAGHGLCVLVAGLVEAAPGKRHTCSPSAGAAFPQGPSLPPDWSKPTPSLWSSRPASP